MTPVWIAITTLSVAVVGLLVTLIGHLIKHSYSMGQRDQRILALEQRPHDGGCETQLAALNATLMGMKETFTQRIADLEHMMRNHVMTRQVSPAPRRVSK